MECVAHLLEGFIKPTSMHWSFVLCNGLQSVNLMLKLLQILLSSLSVVFSKHNSFRVRGSTEWAQNDVLHFDIRGIHCILPGTHWADPTDLTSSSTNWLVNYYFTHKISFIALPNSFCRRKQQFATARITKWRSRIISLARNGENQGIESEYSTVQLSRQQTVAIQCLK